MALPVLPIAAALANVVIPFAADALLPEPEYKLADRLAAKRREIFDLTTSRGSQQYVQAAEILGEQIDKRARGGAFATAGALHEVQTGVNRAGDNLLRTASADLTAGAIADETAQENADYQQAVNRRNNQLRAVGSGLQSLTGLAATSYKMDELRKALAATDGAAGADGNGSVLEALDITSGVNNTDFLNLDFETTSADVYPYRRTPHVPNVSTMGVRAGSGGGMDPVLGGYIDSGIPMDIPIEQIGQGERLRLEELELDRQRQEANAAYGWDPFNNPNPLGSRIRSRMGSGINIS